MSFLSAFLVTPYVLGGNLRFPEHLIFPIYPVLLTLAFFLNTRFLIFGLPAQAGILQFALYFLAIYLLFLTLNILNVATIRTVPLKKAALSTLYFLGLIIGFFNFKGILTLQLSLLVFDILHFALSFLFTLPLIYVIQIKPSPIEEEIGPRPKLMLPEIAVISLLSAEIALIASFLKISPTILSVFLAGILFLMIGFLQHCVKKTLTKKVLWEHIMVAIGLVALLVISV